MAVYPRGKRRIYWMRFKFGGRSIHESTKSTSKTLALEAERQRRRQLEESYNGVKRRKLPPKFDKAADDWYTAIKPHIAERTQDIYDVAIRCHLKPAFGPRLLSDVDSEAITTYQARRRAIGASARTLNKELQVLRQILKRYKLWANLQDEVKFESEPKGIGKALTPEQEARLLEECSKSDSACYTAVVLALNTTMRSDEVKKLRWAQIDLFEQVLTVGKSKTEAGEGRIIPLNAAAVHALANWAEQFPERQADHFVFPWCENKRIEANRPTKGWRTAWRNALQRAGLKLRFHDLRHTAITKLAEGQASEQTIMSIAGHVSPAMLKHYSHIRLAAKRVALNAISTNPPEYLQGVPKSVPNHEKPISAYR